MLWSAKKSLIKLERKSNQKSSNTAGQNKCNPIESYRLHTQSLLSLRLGTQVIFLSPETLRFSTDELAKPGTIIRHSNELATVGKSPLGLCIIDSNIVNSVNSKCVASKRRHAVNLLRIQRSMLSKLFGILIQHLLKDFCRSCRNEGRLLKSSLPAWPMPSIMSEREEVNRCLLLRASS